ncbi:MAG: 3-phosphoshikimate 1-carboxyvinyltransferase, partial [Bacteroidales bacterium]|nr:3-phosphoshikimate 1-carboxyvinyltransferase [Bacteroidales bacterium]
MNILTLNKKDKKLFGEISLPASKSISNRALIINFLSKQTSKIANLSKADDTALMKNLLERIEEAKNTNKIVSLDCKNSGTVMRFLIAVLAQQPGKWRLTGSERMKDRPIGILVESLQQLGANIRYIEKKGFPP